MFCNAGFQDIFNSAEVENLAREGYDHAPLVLSCENSEIKLQ